MSLTYSTQGTPGDRLAALPKPERAAFVRLVEQGAGARLAPSHAARLMRERLIYAVAFEERSCFHLTERGRDAAERIDR